MLFDAWFLKFLYNEVMAQITWETKEFEFREKGPAWYYALALAAIILIAVSLWQNNFLFAIFLAISVILLAILSGRRPASHTIAVFDNKIKIGNHLVYNYDELLGFSLKRSDADARDGQTDKKFARLWLKPKHRFKLHVHIPVPEELLGNVRSALLKEIPEVEHEETLLEAVIDWLKI